MSFETSTIDSTDQSEFYRLLLQQCQGLFYGEKHLLANAANLSSLLYHNLKDVNWVGFYFADQGELVLGPFHGQVACTRIPFGKGVCGTAYESNQTVRVADVNAFDGHIACDSNSASEIVIPLKVEDQLIGVLDIDSPILDRFDQQDQEGLVDIAEFFCQSVEKS